MQRLLVINSRYHVDCGPLETLTAGNTPRTTRTALFVNKARRSRFSFRGFYSVGRNLLSILQTVIIYAEFKSLEPLEQLVSYRKKKKNFYPIKPPPALIRSSVSNSVDEPWTDYHGSCFSRNSNEMDRIILNLSLTLLLPKVNSSSSTLSNQSTSRPSMHH